MTFRVGALLTAAAVVWMAGVSGRAGVAAQAQKSVWDGVYTEEQAKRGEEAFTKECSSCHGNDLAGDGFAPSLAGPEFASAWDGLSVGDLLERIRVSMPPTDPGIVPVPGKVDIIAFLLKSNKFPAGKEELAKEPEALKQIAYKAHQ